MGTRPAANGQTNVSTGHADLDRLLGGGVPLGSLTIILEDGWSHNHITLMRYFLAEGAACGHSLRLCTARKREGGLENLIPCQAMTRSRKAGAEEQHQDSNIKEEVQLRIAWQYEKYLKKKDSKGVPARDIDSRMHPVLGSSRNLHASRGASVAGKQWCHTYDLTKPCGADALENVPNSIYAIEDQDMHSRKHLACSCSEFVASLGAEHGDSSSKGEATREDTDSPAILGDQYASGAQRGLLRPNQIGRFAVESLGDIAYGFGIACERSGMEVVRSLIHIHAAVQTSSCAAMVTIPGNVLDPSTVIRVQHIADAVIVLEAATDYNDMVRLAPDPQSIVGLLRIRKLPALGTFLRHSPKVPLHFVRTRRRSLHLTQVEIDPDAEADDDSGIVSASAAAVVCGGPSTEKHHLDF